MVVGAVHGVAIGGWAVVALAVGAARLLRLRRREDAHERRHRANDAYRRGTNFHGSLDMAVVTGPERRPPSIDKEA